MTFSDSVKRLSLERHWFTVGDWKTPYRQTAYWIIGSLVLFAITSIVTWFKGFGGIFVAIPVALALCVIWLGVWILGLKEAWVRRGDGRLALFAGLAPVAGFVLTVALALPTIWAVAWGLDWISFYTNRASYLDVIHLAQSGEFDESSQGYQSHRGTTFLLDGGPPLRVAFPNPGGFLDNWSGVVFDPTGDVMLADGFDPETGEFAAPDRITKLFYGDIVSCRQMQGYFYHCSFT